LRDVVGELVTKLSVSNCQAVQDAARVEELALSCHRIAAAELAKLCKLTIHSVEEGRRDRLLAFMESIDAWNGQLRARIEDELVGCGLLKMRAAVQRAAACLLGRFHVRIALLAGWQDLACLVAI
jgi:hypothetical protein